MKRILCKFSILMLFLFNFNTHFEYNKHFNSLYRVYPDGYPAGSLLKDGLTHNNCSSSAYIKLSP